MAWGVFAFSKDGRQQAAAVLRGLLIAQLVVSLSMVIFCYNTSLRVMLLLKHVHKVTVYLLYGLILLQAYCMKLHYTSGLRLITLLLQCPHWSRATLVTVFLLYGLILLQAYCMKLHYTSGLRLITLLLQCPHWSRATLVSRVWLASGAVVAANGMLVYAACRGTLMALMKQLSSSLRIGISQYLTEPTWKRLLDTMQVELSCCGVEKPSDWHEIPWINMDFLNEDSDLVMKLAGADGKVLPPVTPYSCCTPRVLAACYHDPLQQSECREIWRDSPLLPASLHARGCVEAVRHPLRKALLALYYFSVLVLLLQLIITVLTQLLRTSSRDAVLRGDCDGPGRGYLIDETTPNAGPKDDTQQDTQEPMSYGGASAARAASVCCAHAHRRTRVRTRRKGPHTRACLS